MIGLEAASGYKGWEQTSSCKCPLNVRIDKAQPYETPTGTNGLGVGLDMSITFSMPVPESEPCKCLDVRSIQMVGRFDENGKPESGLDRDRNERTTEDGWRIDWPLGKPPGVPFIDNAGYGSSHSPGGPRGISNDPGAVVRKQGHSFKAYTCFVGKKKNTGDLVWLGCLHWGLTLVKEGIRKGSGTREYRPAKFQVLDGTPSFTCSPLAGIYGAIDKWNSQNPGFETPVIHENF
jgi:hypothetical protein